MEHMRIHLGSVEQIPLGQGRCFKIGFHEVAVFRYRDGRLGATENRCPHRGGPLAEGIIGDGKVVCPLHGHKFDLRTGEGTEPAECVKAFKVFEENQKMILEFAVSAKSMEKNNCVTTL